MFYKKEIVISHENESEIINKINEYLDRDTNHGFINGENFQLYYMMDDGRYSGERGLSVEGTIIRKENYTEINLYYGRYTLVDWLGISFFIVLFILYLYLEITHARLGKGQFNLNFLILVIEFFMIIYVYIQFSRQYDYLKKIITYCTR